MKSAIQNRSREIAKLPPWEGIIRGTLMRYRLTCGNKGCRCHQAKQWRHGPYWYVAVSYGKGKRRQRLVLIPDTKAARARAAILAYQRLWKSLVRISDINLDLLKAGAGDLP